MQTASNHTTAAHTTPVSLATPSPTPYSAAIAALFPAPTQTYNTPGLQAHRHSFTTNAELQEWVQALPQRNAEGLSLDTQSIGTSTHGHPIWAVIANGAGEATAADLEANQRPNVLIVAGQQGDAPASTEAALALLQELQPGGLLAASLAKVNLIVVPRANPDGFEAHSAFTADGTDLRHDHLTLKTAEAKSLAQLFHAFHPTVVIDLGEFAAIEPTLQRFGALRANDVGLQYAYTPNAHEFITKAAKDWFYQPLAQQLSQSGLRVDWTYYATGHDALSGFAMETVQPTTLANTSALKNAVALTIQSRGSDLDRTHIERRVHSLVQATVSVLESAGQRSNELRKIQAFVARDIASKACRSPLTVQAEPAAEQRAVTLVNAQTAQLQPITTSWSSSLSFKATQVRNRPCGYWLSAEAATTAERLSAHGVWVQRVAELSMLTAEGDAAVPTTIETPPGSYYISMNQPLANLTAAALEDGPSYSYGQQGILQQRDHMARITAPANLVFEDD